MLIKNPMMMMISELLSGKILLNLQRGIIPLKMKAELRYFVLCTLPDNALYLSQVLRKYLKGSLS